ncbi:GNAT family N-acetyltransferase [Bacillus testis]|uniref:GNAT family N-acetyltransferase n=1 Tax=Bacillus testis TaxID=1622072 RepID=UPI00067F640D|nr:GNAT family N-acetyltransferase [Bacillus testis]
MLIRYKKNFEKIAMGLLSFMPNEKDVKTLQAAIKQYETQDNWNLLLWKEDEDIIGLIGVEVEPEDTVTIQHLTVNPSFRYQGIGRKMCEELANMYSTKKIQSSDVIAPFLDKCRESEDK